MFQGECGVSHRPTSTAQEKFPAEALSRGLLPRLHPKGWNEQLQVDSSTRLELWT